MRTIPADLLTAQKSASAEPFVDVVASNEVAGVRRLDFLQLNATSNPIAKHDIAVAGDGSVTRVRIDAGALKQDRATDPGATGPWNTWNNLATGMGTNVACAAKGTRVIVVYTDAAGTGIKMRESTDSGATYAAEVAVVTAGAAVTDLAVAYKNSGGDHAIVFGTATALSIIKRTSGAYGSVATHGTAFSSVNGVAAAYGVDWSIIVTGVEATTLKPSLWTTTYGDGGDVAANTWGALFVQQQAESDASVTYQAPSLVFTDCWRATFVEADAFTGGATRTYRFNLHPSLGWTAGAYSWRTPAPVNYAQAQGLAIAADAGAGGYIYEHACDLVQRAPKSAVTQSLTSSVLAVEIFESAGDLRGHIDLENTSGAFASAGIAEDGPPAPLRIGNLAAVSWGYNTASGRMASRMADVWIAGYEYHRAGGASVLRLRVEGGWALLARSRQRTSIVHVAAADSYFTILFRIFARAGLALSSSGASARLSSVKPAFTVHPQTSGLEAARQALAFVADRTRMTQSAGASITEPLTTASTNYTFGTDHPLRDARIATEAPPATEGHAFGAGAFGEAIDYANAQVYAGSREQQRDVTSTTGAQAAATAAAHLRQRQLDASAGRLVVPPSCGLEPLDVVDTSDPLIAASAAKRRVASITWRYNVRRAVYEQQIELSAM